MSEERLVRRKPHKSRSFQIPKLLIPIIFTLFSLNVYPHGQGKCRRTVAGTTEIVEHLTNDQLKAVSPDYDGGHGHKEFNYDTQTYSWGYATKGGYEYAVNSLNASSRYISCGTHIGTDHTHIPPRDSRPGSHDPMHDCYEYHQHKTFEHYGRDSDHGDEIWHEGISKRDGCGGSNSREPKSDLEPEPEKRTRNRFPNNVNNDNDGKDDNSGNDSNNGANSGDSNNGDDDPSFLPEDVDRDGDVDNDDLTAISMNFGSTAAKDLERYDIDGDSDIDTDDFEQVQSQLGSGVNSAPAATLALHLKRIKELDIPDTSSKPVIQPLERRLPKPAPKRTALLANYPNPFNPETWIPYRLAKPTDVTLTIYAANGDVVRSLALGHQYAGVYVNRTRAAYWDGKDACGESVASGIYFYTLTTDDFSATRKMLIAK